MRVLKNIVISDTENLLLVDHDDGTGYSVGIVNSTKGSHGTISLSECDNTPDESLALKAFTQRAAFQGRNAHKKFFKN